MGMLEHCAQRRLREDVAVGGQIGAASGRLEDETDEAVARRFLMCNGKG